MAAVEADVDVFAALANPVRREIICASVAVRAA